MLRKRVQAGLFWQASDGPFSLDDLARRLAPTVWFSPDEPLLQSAIPANLTGDPSEATVYYSIMDVTTTGRTPLFDDNPHVEWSFSKEVGREDAHRIKTAVIRYYFYYPVDVGFFGHDNDLESFQIEIEGIDVQQDKTKEHGLRVKSMAGAAHGVGWYTNELVLKYEERDADKIRFREDDYVMLPPFVLVEEGKHASSPDRNGDGQYTPGYDITHYPRDAWGIRDVLAGQYLSGSSFAAHMAKTRHSDTQRLVGAVDGPLKANEYRLRFGPASAACDKKSESPIATLDGNLRGFIRKMHLCSTQTSPRGKVESTIGGLTTRAYGKGIELIGLNFRLEGGSRQIAFGLGAFRVKRFDGWFTPRLNIVLNGGVEQRGLQRDFLGFDGLYTLSASRLADWYMSFGRERWANDDLSSVDWRWATEFGWKLRFPLPEGSPVPFVGVRTGVRVNDYRTLRTARLVAEFGLGAW